MKKIVDFYISHVQLIGALYCAVPATVWFLGTLIFTEPFREVYLVRFVIMMAVGCAAGAYINKIGLGLWIAKHKGKYGPGTIAEGAMIGALIGLGQALLPALTSLIGTNHPDLAKSIIISVCVSSPVFGGFFGTILSSVGRRYITRDVS